MNLKELIKEVESLQYNQKQGFNMPTATQLKGIKQTVEAIDNEYGFIIRKYNDRGTSYWQTLKKLLGLK